MKKTTIVGLKSRKSSPSCQQLLSLKKKLAISNLQQGRALGSRFPENSEAEFPQANLSTRINLISLAIFVSVSFLVYHLVCLQGNSSSYWEELAAKQHSTFKKIGGARGSIFDRRGRPLAVSIQTINAGLHPNKIQDLDKFSGELSSLLGISAKVMSEKLQEPGKFTWLARGLHPDLLKERNLKTFSALSLFSAFQRVYPQGDLASLVLGKVGRDGAGLAGVEKVFNGELTALSRKLVLERDARGRLSADLPGELLNISNKSEERFRHEGSSLELSIDIMAQKILSEELDRALVDSEAKKAFGLLVDAETGEVLSISQTGRFNPNSTKSLVPADLRNSVLQDSFEPGSTLKPLVVAGAIDSGSLGINEILDCEKGKLRIGKHTIRDVHPEEKLSIADVVIRSSNVCMAKISARMGKSNLYSYFQDMGLGENSGLEWSGESKGILRPVSKWREIDLATASFGHGLAVSAAQLVRAYSAIANAGLMHKLSLLKNGTGRQPEQLRRVFSERTANSIKSILRGVVEDEHGTGKRARIDGLEVFGKTGTAHKPRSDGKGYDSERVLSSFIGFVDGQNIGVPRKLVLYIGVDEPSVKPRWGGTVAAPVFSRVMERTLQYLLTVGGEGSKKGENTKSA